MEWGKERTLLPLWPGAALVKGRVHELTGRAAMAVAAAMAGLTDGSVIWITHPKDSASLNPHGLRPFLHPDRVFLVHPANPKEGLWAAETALRQIGRGAVIIDYRSVPSLTESRRLQLAAESGGGLGLMMVSERTKASAAETRWQCDPIATKTDCPGWHCALIKNKSGTIMSQQVAWDVIWKQPPGRFDLVSETAGEPAFAR